MASIQKRIGDSGEITYRVRVLLMMTSGQLAEAQRLAREWMAKYQQ